MLRQIRQRLPYAVRAGLMLVFAMCLVVQPVLGALGEMHEAAAHAYTTLTSLHQDHLVPHGDETLGQGTPHDDGSSTLHLLLHFAHCCGQSMGFAVEALIAPAMRIDAARLLPPVSVRDVGAHLTSPFRPPISA